MRIAIDARKLMRADSGIGGYTLNLARALLEEDKEIELVLICGSTQGRGRLQDPRVTEVVFPFPHVPLDVVRLRPFSPPAALRCFPLALGDASSETPPARGGDHPRSQLDRQSALQWHWFRLMAYAHKHHGST